jgi:hypothetical protein
LFPIAKTAFFIALLAQGPLNSPIHR